jgi:hypothetical protein
MLDHIFLSVSNLDRSIAFIRQPSHHSESPTAWTYLSLL